MRADSIAAARSARPPSINRARMRPASSAAAFFVNVVASTRWGRDAAGDLGDDLLNEAERLARPGARDDRVDPVLHSDLRHASPLTRQSVA